MKYRTNSRLNINRIFTLFLVFILLIVSIPGFIFIRKVSREDRPRRPFNWLLSECTHCNFGCDWSDETCVRCQQGYWGEFCEFSCWSHCSTGCGFKTGICNIEENQEVSSLNDVNGKCVAVMLTLRGGLSNRLQAIDALYALSLIQPEVTKIYLGWYKHKQCNIGAEEFQRILIPNKIFKLFEVSSRNEFETIVRTGSLENVNCTDVIYTDGFYGETKDLFTDDETRTIFGVAEEEINNVCMDKIHFRSLRESVTLSKQYRYEILKFKVDNHYSKKFVIGVHLRMTEIFSTYSARHSSTMRKVELLINDVEKAGKQWVIFLATDSGDSQTSFVDRFGKGNVIFYSNFTDLNDRQVRLGVQGAILDQFTLYESDSFVGTPGSSFTRRVKNIMKKKVKC